MVYFDVIVGYLILICFVQNLSKKLTNSGQNASLYCSEFLGKDLYYEYGISPNKQSPSQTYL
jgi:hypothetical protein